MCGGQPTCWPGLPSSAWWKLVSGKDVVEMSTCEWQTPAPCDAPSDNLQQQLKFRTKVPRMTDCTHDCRGLAFLDVLHVQRDPGMSPNVQGALFRQLVGAMNTAANAERRRAGSAPPDCHMLRAGAKHGTLAYGRPQLLLHILAGARTQQPDCLSPAPLQACTLTKTAQLHCWGSLEHGHSCCQPAIVLQYWLVHPPETSHNLLNANYMGMRSRRPPV